MRIRFVLTLATILPLLPSGALAQSASADVTFEVPLNLTSLPSQITKVAVMCRLTSSALMSRGSRVGQSEVAVAQGAVVTTVQVVVPILSRDLISASGKSADYECKLLGFEAASQNWIDLGASSSLVLPQPAPITGSFWW
jgi:hypothetical protein